MEALEAAAMRASDDSRPALAARRLRSALRLLDGMSGPAARLPDGASRPAASLGDASGPAASLLGDASVPGSEAAVRGRVLISLAWAESERGRVDLGFRLLDEAESLLPAGDRGTLRAQRALLLHRHGRHDEAMHEFDAAIDALDQRVQPLATAKALNNRSVLHLDAGNVGPARDDLRRSLRITERHGIEVGAALIRVNLGCLDVVSGDLPSALRAFAAGRIEYDRVAPGRMAGLAVEQARALIAAGLFREADRDLAEAMRQAHDQHGSHHYAIAVQARAEAALLGGRPAVALDWARQARSLFLARRNTRLAAVTTLLALRAESAAGLAARSGGASGPDRAAGLGGDVGLGGAVNFGGAAGPDRASSLSGSSLLGAAGPAAGLAGRARRHAGKLRAMGLPEDARVAALVAARALLPRSPAAAARLIERYGRPGRLDRLDTRLLWRLARAEHARATGDRRAATRHLTAGMAALHRHRAQLGCLDLQTGASVHGRDLTRAGLSAALRDGTAHDVYRWSERARAQALLLPSVRPPDDPAAAATLEDLRHTGHALRQADLAGHPSAELRVRAERLQRVVREGTWSTPGGVVAGNRGSRGNGGAEVTTTGRPAPLTEVRTVLGDAALVAYLRDGDRLAALVVTGRATWVVPLGGWRAAEEAVLRLRADLDTRAGRAMPGRLADAVRRATRTDAEALAAAILDPLWPMVGDRDLVVVPTGLLMTTPWAVLPGNAGRPVTVAPSATAWLAARHRRDTHPGGAASPVGGPGKSRGGGAGNGRGGGLALVSGPGISRGAEEIAAIARLCPGATVLSGAAATPAATLAAMDGVAVAHLAAHGRHQAENALFSALELAGGPVLGYDLQRLERPPALVVLSSCELGLSDVRPGDESFGLGSALLVAGTATVVASVSRVADDAAMETMVGFHRAIARGCAPAAALAAAGGAEFVCLGAG